MKRIMSEMTGAELEAWRQRHKLTEQQAADLVGASVRQYQRAVDSNHVPLQIATIIELREQLNDHVAVKAITIRQLAKIAAHNGK